MDFRLISLILLIHISGCLSLDLLSVTCEDVCALRENTVELKCSYSEINTKTVFWFSRKQSKNWRKIDEPEDLTLDSDYSGRVKKEAANYLSTLTISDLRERDSGEYQIMFIMKDGVKRLSSVAVNLTVTDLWVKMNPETTDPRDQRVTLTCGSSCDFTSRLQNYFWKKNGQYFNLGDYIYRRIIFLPNEADDSYSCSLTPDHKISSSPVCISKDRCWDVTYTSRRVCALMGSTVDISCTYSHPSGHTVNKTFWHYDRPGDFKDLHEKHQFAGRVEYVGNTLRIKELKMNDSGEYRFRIITDRTEGTYSGTPGVILTVTDTMVTSSPDIISERQEVILSCSTKCTLSDKHTYIWYKNGRQVTDGFTKDNKLYLDSVSNEELQEYSCEIQITPNQEASTALQNTVITLSVFLVLALIGVLWYRRRRNNSSQQHEKRKDDVQSGSVTLYENAEALSIVCTQDVKDQDVHYSTINFKQSHIKDTSLAPTAVHSTSDDVHYASVKFSLPSV